MRENLLRRDVTLAVVLCLTVPGGCGSSGRGAARSNNPRPVVLASTARPLPKPPVARPAGVLEQLPAIHMGPVHVGTVGF